MLAPRNVVGILFIGMFIVAACASTDEFSSTPAVVIVPSRPVPTKVTTFPTPSSPGDPATWRDLKVVLDQAEVTDRFVNEFGSQRVPSAGQKFLWAQVTLKNVGTNEILFPEPENFSVLYAESEFKPIYGHRQGYPDYADLDSTLFPEQEVDGWLRFDIPIAADLNDLWFVFLPTSAQVGVSPSSPNYPYAENKPTYVWQCE